MSEMLHLLLRINFKNSYALSNENNKLVTIMNHKIS